MSAPRVRRPFARSHASVDDATQGRNEMLDDGRTSHATAWAAAKAGKPLGQGTIPLQEIVDALGAAGYDGFYDVELLGEEIETIDYNKLLEHAKQAYGEMVGGGQ